MTTRGKSHSTPATSALPLEVAQIRVAAAVVVVVVVVLAVVVVAVQFCTVAEDGSRIPSSHRLNPKP